MNRLMVPPLPAASRPSKRRTWRPPVSTWWFWNFSSSTWSAVLLLVVLLPGHPLVVGVVLPPGVDRSARRVDQHRVVVVVLADGVALDVQPVDVLANVLQHGPAPPATVELRRRPGGVRRSLAQDGTSPPVERGRPMGCWQEVNRR